MSIQCVSEDACRDANALLCVTQLERSTISIPISDSVFNKMSRKDKYETNNRRTQTFMSAEDVAAGRKSSWQGVEITGEYEQSADKFLHLF